MSLTLTIMLSIENLLVKVLKKIISLICFRVYLEVIVFKNPMCFSRWSFRGINNERSFGNFLEKMLRKRVDKNQIVWYYDIVPKIQRKKQKNIVNAGETRQYE